MDIRTTNQNVAKKLIYPFLKRINLYWDPKLYQSNTRLDCAKEMISSTEESNTVLDLESPPLQKSIGVAISVEEIAQQHAHTKFISFACPIPYDESIVVPPANNDDFLLDNPQLVTRLPIPPAMVNSYGEMAIGIVGTITMLGRTTAMIWWSWGRIIMVPPVSTPNLSNDTESTIPTTTTTTNFSGTGTLQYSSPK
jgi:hypothetical protein